MKRPAMIGESSSHRGRPRHPVPSPRAPDQQWHPQTLMISTEVVNRSNQIHPDSQRGGLSQETPPAAHQTGQPRPEGGIESFDVGRINHAAALRSSQQVVDLGLRALPDAAEDTHDMPLGILFDDLCNHNPIPQAQARPSLRSGGNGLAEDSLISRPLRVPSCTCALTNARMPAASNGAARRSVTSTGPANGQDMTQLPADTYTGTMHIRAQGIPPSVR